MPLHILSGLIGFQVQRDPESGPIFELNEPETPHDKAQLRELCGQDFEKVFDAVTTLRLELEKAQTVIAESKLEILFLEK
jgi:uroporphyrinogen-III decarboxylase